MIGGGGNNMWSESPETGTNVAQGRHGMALPYRITFIIDTPAVQMCSDIDNKWSYSKTKPANKGHY